MYLLVSSTGTINIEACDNLRDGTIQSQDNLDMASRILAGNRDSVLRSNTTPHRARVSVLFFSKRQREDSTAVM